MPYAEHNGNVTATSQAQQWRTLCTDVGTNIHGQWPYDVLSCDIELGMLEQPAQLRPVAVATTVASEDTSGWHLVQVRLLNQTVYDVYEGDERSKPTAACDIVYRLTLRRNSVFYVRVFVTPLLVVHVLMLASFCCSGGSSGVRGGLCALALTLTAVVLLLAGQYTPNSYVPLLIRWYEATLWLAWLACVMFVVDRRLAVGALLRIPSSGNDGDGANSSGQGLRRLLQAAWLRTMFGLESMTVSVSYNKFKNKILEPTKKYVQAPLAITFYFIWQYHKTLLITLFVLQFSSLIYKVSGVVGAKDSLRV